MRKVEGVIGTLQIDVSSLDEEYCIATILGMQHSVLKKCNASSGLSIFSVSLLSHQSIDVGILDEQLGDTHITPKRRGPGVTERV